MNDQAERINDWDELYPGRFLKAGLLAPNEKRILTIASVTRDELVGNKGPQIKGIVGFREDTMALALNKTNGICLREMFGRVPYQWVGRRIALFATEWGGEPCIRIWGSPDLEQDIEVTIELPRKKPFRMVMHAMRPPVRAVGGAPMASPPKQELSDDARGHLAAMARATTLETLMDIEAEVAMRALPEHESNLLSRALGKRRKQITDGQ